MLWHKQTVPGLFHVASCPQGMVRFLHLGFGNPVIDCNLTDFNNNQEHDVLKYLNEESHVPANNSWLIV